MKGFWLGLVGLHRLLPLTGAIRQSVGLVQT